MNLGTNKNLDLWLQLVCTKFKLKHVIYICNYVSSSVKSSSQKSYKPTTNPSLIYTNNTKAHKLQYEMRKRKEGMRGSKLLTQKYIPWYR